MADLPKGLRVRGKSKLIEINLYYKGERLFVRTGLPATKENLKHASILRETMINAIKHDKLNGTEHFNITDYLPESGKINQLLGRNTVNKGATFQDYAEKYRKRILECHESGELKYSSLKSYKTGLRRLETAAFYKMKMRDIKKSHIQEYITQLLMTVGKKSVNNLLTPMRQAFEMAFEDEVIDSNPADRVRNPKFPKPEMQPFTRDEVLKILAYLREHHPEHAGYIAFVVYTGCRIGEAMAAKWENLSCDGDEWAYYINKNIVEGKESTPKTIESIREVPVLEPLKPYIQRQKAISLMASEYIFPNPRTGRPFNRNRPVINGIWRPTLKKLKIAYRDMKQLRHTHAVLALIAEDNLHDIAKRLGHANTGITTKAYIKYHKGYSKRSNLETYLDEETNCKSSDLIKGGIKDADSSN
ncbi:site-specific integrase [Limisalsivibrio acetivorans]|uniref:site-specific integrase n=1 Tax=Limisalsivibrio acetivorans TaxID=1304888 RepID=UPI0003B3D386|nr:site-specific integrase [Limisalsivibrio acetivorans]